MRTTVRRASDGAVRVVGRSMDVQGCEVPSGYVRSEVDCGGYEIVPTGTDRCLFKYGAQSLYPTCLPEL